MVEIPIDAKNGVIMILLLCFSLMVWSGSDPYVVILKNTSRLEAKSPPEFKSGRAVIELLSGEKVTLPDKMIDMAATKALNEELAKVREKQERLEQLQEMEKKAAAEAARTARKPVVLEGAEALPEYDDNLKIIGGQEAAEPTGDVPASQPYAKKFRSDDPVYVAAERRTRLANGGYRVECDIKVNHVTGAENVVLTYTANFVSAAAEKHTIEVSPKSLDFNQVVTVSFDLTTNDELFRTEHGITAEIQE